MLLGVFGIVVVVRRSLQDLKNITEVAEEASKENFNVRVVNIHSKNEIGFLANVFNKMLDRIKLSSDSLKSINVEIRKKEEALETKVAELEKYKELTVGRELKMMELKKEINKIKQTKDDHIK
jgi:methyl-accepting chemotaxis protein